MVTGPPKKTILIVDDEFGILEVLESILRDAGYEVITAINGREALVRLSESKPNLVVTDFMMPLLDGAGILQYMRANDGFRKTPVILASALSEKTISERCSGYDVFLRKPYKTERLIKEISRLLNPNPGESEPSNN
jgi:CheY-like chemotaxis protein